VPSLALSLGGESFLVRSTSPSLLELLRQRYEKFIAEALENCWQVEVSLADASERFSSDLSVQASGGAWWMERADFRGQVQLERRRGFLMQTQQIYSFDTFLRILLSLHLVRTGGLLLHAASILREGSGYLFVGRSGAGKSTIARRAGPGGAVSSDEISLVRPSGDGYQVYGTPFWGELAGSGENIAAPLAQICVLEQSGENRLEPLDRAEALRRILQCVLFFARDAENARAVLHAVERLITAVPVARLYFRPTEEFWSLLTGAQSNRAGKGSGAN
jgi:hypothetical protein